MIYILVGLLTHFHLLAQIPTKVFTVDQVLSNYVYVFYAAFVVSFIFTPVMRATALYYGIIDRPDRLRKMHSSPVAYLGGVAVFVGWLSGLVVSQYLILHRADPGWPTQHPIVRFSIVLGALVIILLGLWDDLIGLRPWMKISGQVFAAVALLYDRIGRQSALPFLNHLWIAAGHAFHGPFAAAQVPDGLQLVDGRPLELAGLLP